MEGTTRLSRASARRDVGVMRLTQIGLLVASLGAILIVFNIFGLGVVGVVLAVIGAVLAFRGGVGRRWYVLLAAGALFAVVSRLLAEGSETLGGWLAVFASIAILVGSTLGYPTAADESE
jgi:hypothetical protein